MGTFDERNTNWCLIAAYISAVRPCELSLSCVYLFLETLRQIHAFFYKKVRIPLINKNFLKKSVILLIKSFLRLLLFLNFISIRNICYRNLRNVRNVIYKNFLNFWPFYIYFLINYFLIKTSSQSSVRLGITNCKN